MNIPWLIALRKRCQQAGYGLVGLCLGWFTLSAQAEDLQIQVIGSDDQGLTLLLTSPEPALNPVAGTDSGWYQLVLPNTTTKQVLGQPALPQRGVLVGIPEGAGISLTVIDAQYRDITGRAIAPSLPQHIQGDMPPWQLYEHYLDQSFYARDALYPASPVTIGFQGQLRDQPIAQILFLPVQVNPARQTLRVYRQLRVRVEFDRPLRRAVGSEVSSPASSVSGMVSQRAEHDPFAAVMNHSLINAGQVGR